MGDGVRYVICHSGAVVRFKFQFFIDSKHLRQMNHQINYLTPYFHDYYEKIINFMRNFLCSGLKDTDQYLEKSIITGIMRIARESIFSGLNNPGVYTLLSEEFDDKFGFTEQEVEALLKDFQLLDMYDQVQKWYNGYQFGKRIIYNPWSIINFLGSKGKELQPYWINTSDNEIVETLLSRGGKELKEELELLIRGETVEKAIENNIVLKDIPNRESGYGRYDIMIIPHDVTRVGYVIEFKTVDTEDNETVEIAVAAALEQIEKKKYETELVERGIENIKKLAIVFSGKDVYVKKNSRP
jgi:hypothetical protein